MSVHVLASLRLAPLRLAERGFAFVRFGATGLVAAAMVAAGLLLASPALAQTGQLVGLADKCVDVFQADTADGTPVVLWECTGNANQQWSFETTGEESGLYEVVGLGERCLVPGPVGASGHPELEIGPCDQAAAAWGAESLAGVFHLVHEETQLCLDVFGSDTDNGTPLILFECLDQANQDWRLVSLPALPAYFVPYVEVDRFNPLGVTTLFAVRNPGDAAVMVRYEIFGSGDGPGDADVIQEIELGPGAVRTVDVRSVAGFFSSLGWVGITAIDAQTGQPLAVQDLYGDYFRLDRLNDFASGDRLLDRDSSLCGAWHVRFFNGGDFNGGTRFRFFVPDHPGSWTAIGRVLDESGTEVQTYTVTSPARASSLSSFVLLPAFGVVEWQFEDGVEGHVSAVMDALGEFSVGLEAECRD